MNELKDYSILDIEAIDDERFKKEKAPGKWVQESRVYLKEDVDTVIMGLKAKLESVQASMYCDVVDAGMRERRLRRAFYKACANWAHVAVAFFSSYATKEKWRKMENKCRAKEDEYK